MDELVKGDVIECLVSNGQVYVGIVDSVSPMPENNDAMVWAWWIGEPDGKKFAMRSQTKKITHINED